MLMFRDKDLTQITGLYSNWMIEPELVSQQLYLVNQNMMTQKEARGSVVG
jgi:hypothetical protein